MFMPVPQNSLFPEGYNKQSRDLPGNLLVKDSLLSCTRSPDRSTKIGSEAGDLFWGDSRWLVHIRAPREAQGDFPDQGSSAEIYTNADPLPYVELETLGPFSRLRVGESILRKQTYHLHRRTQAPLEEQVRALLKNAP
jgi:hypothetical protein